MVFVLRLYEDLSPCFYTFTLDNVVTREVAARQNQLYLVLDPRHHPLLMNDREVQPADSS